ncbi:unnamed protein product [Ectocarpus sp. 8 AP-2014]
MLALGAVDVCDGDGDASAEDDEGGRRHGVGDGVEAEDEAGHVSAGRGDVVSVSDGYDGDHVIAAATGEADAGGGNTLMSSVRAQNEDISSRLQDMSLQEALGLSSSASSPASAAPEG